MEMNAGSSLLGGGNFETEYREVCNNLRFYGELRFKQLTVFLTLTGALLVWISAKTTISWTIIPIALIGMIATGLFVVVEISSSRYWENYWTRAKELEFILRFGQYRQTIRGTSIFNSAAKATRVLYGLVAMLWAIIAVIELAKLYPHIVLLG